MGDFPVLEEFIRQALDTNRKSRLKANELFQMFNPGMDMPLVNLSEMRLQPETRQFLLEHVRQKCTNVSLNAELSQDFCALLENPSGQLATTNYNGLALLLNAIAIPL
mmetsp:Transcript_64746/g.54941  ORF Transcript_64746/g.54941 Transcript_64746/m.54941 type:complete len:108 (-) Transcript_64746:16-339(-)